MKYSEAQKKAITHNKGPLMVLASPGSGKTMVVTRHTKYLIEQYHVNPSNILVITFTKAAAGEMKQRFDKLMGEATRVTFGTFHAVFFRILKHAYNYNASNIIREEVKRRYIRELVLAEGLELFDEEDVVNAIISEISLVKGEMLDLDSYYSVNCPEDSFRRIFKGYVKQCGKERLLDFDDMQSYTYDLLRQRQDILAMWQQHFKYILIDEFQDISHIQYEIVKMLAKPQDNLFIVGDDDQSIYHFRGARPEIMLNFTKDYKNADTVLLDTNYRSSEDVVEASKLLIANNEVRYKKAIRAAKGKQEPVKFLEFEGQRGEHEHIISAIEGLHEAGTPYSDMAVLFRTNSQPRFLAERLMEYNIPFRMKDSIPNLYEHWVSKNILSYIRLAMGNLKRSNFLTIMNRPNRYLSRELFDKEIIDFDRIKQKLSDRNWMAERVVDLEYQIDMLKKMTPYAAVNFIRKGIGYDDYIEEYCKERNIDKGEFFDILEELMEASKEYKTYDQWFTHIKEYGERLKSKNLDEDEAVMLATMHGSKGLEFEAVFIIDACEGVTPHKKALRDSELEEERRLFYVAMTRAKKYLYIYSVKNIFNKEMEPSRFLKELESLQFL